MKHAILSLISFILFNNPLNAAQSITPKDASEKIKTGEAILIDVREEDEIKETGKASPAVWLPKSAVDSQSGVYKDFLKMTSKNKLVIAYCRSGRRAGVVADILSKEGYKTANMGGLSDWQEAGLPVTK